MADDDKNASKMADSLGKKVFFLYPHSVIQEELVSQIVQNEFEIYLAHDHKRLRKLLEKYNDSIVFVNIDERLKEDEWVSYVRNLVESEETKDVSVGILTYNENKELAQTYLMDIGVQAGYIQLKLGLKESSRIILKTLVANEAKGKRKFVRAKCSKNNKTEFNVHIFGKNQNGIVIDISSAGMACTFYSSLDIPTRTDLDQIQLKLRSRIVMVSGIVAGKRKDEGGDTVYVVLFTSFVSSEAKNRIGDFIYRTLQNELDRELQAITVTE
ncbi:MAG: PilZ domain-containing protein [Spirochaetaceae bacterium]